MGDRVWAAITIGGDIAADRVGELVGLIRDTFGREEAAMVEATGRAGVEALYFCDDDVNYGTFGIEDSLEALGLSFDVEWEAGCEFEAGAEGARPGKGRRDIPVNGRVELNVPQIDRIVELIEGGQGGDAVAELRKAAGVDIAPVPPLRIVG